MIKIKILEIIPGERVGNIYLGMKREEVHEILSVNKSIIEETESYLREFYSEHEIYIEYNCDRNVICIEVTDTIKDMYKVFLYGLEVFETKAEVLINRIKQESEDLSCGKDELLSTDYRFKKLGLSLWRSSAFHPKLLKDPEFLEMRKAIQEDEMRYWYFESISIKII